MPKKIISNILILLIAGLSLFLLLLLKDAEHDQSIFKAKAGAKKNSTEHIGEKITYDVYLGWVHLGQSTFRRLPNTVLGKKEVALMIFETNIKGFHDLEKIYSDIESFLPIQVTRDINGWGMNEKITEDYNQKDFTLTFTKIRADKREESAIKSGGPIHNAILLPFHIRRVAEPKIGWSIVARIPQEFEIKLTAIEEVKVPAGTFPAYYFKSTPANFEIWVSVDEFRIPLKIKSMGSTMVMKEHSL